MKTSFDSADIVRQALFLRNACGVLDDIDEEIHRALRLLVQDRLSELDGWIYDDEYDCFGPIYWCDDDIWPASFELICWGNPDSWLLAAARQEDRFLAVALSITGTCADPDTLLELEAIVEEQKEKLEGVESRLAPSGNVGGRRLLIPLPGLSLKQLEQARSGDDWERLLSAPVHEAMSRALKLYAAIRELISSRIE